MALEAARAHNCQMRGRQSDAHIIVRNELIESSVHLTRDVLSTYNNNENTTRRYL